MPWQMLDLGKKINACEQVGLVIFWIWNIILLLQLPNWIECFLFFMLSNMLMGILHLQITLSHWEMPTFRSDEKIEMDFFTEQIVTSRDININIFISMFYGGLQYQIEHHLFPRMPRQNLKKIRNFIEPLCKKHNLTFTSTTIFTALFDLIANLYNVSNYVSEVR